MSELIKDLDSLQFAEYNPRIAKKEFDESLQKSMDEFGDISGITKNMQTGNLVTGHQRIRLLRSKFGARAKVHIETRYPEPDQVGTVALGFVGVEGTSLRLNYREVQWDEGTEKAANIAANKIEAEWDKDLLAQVTYEISQLENGADLLALTGMMEDEINKHLDAVGALGERDPSEDEAPELDETNPPVSKPGEIYQLGRHRLMCADSTVKENVEKLMGGNKADMVFTDPPYGMLLDTDYSGMHKSSDFGKGGKTYDKVIGDNDDFTPELITSIFDNFSYCKEIFLWGADYYRWLIPKGGSWLVWDKRGGDTGMNLDKLLGSSFELCWTLKSHKRDIARVLWSGHHGMHKSDQKSRTHPTEKPTELARWFFERWGKQTKNVADVYLGSGSTLIACEQTDRTCYGMELDPKYCDVIRKRYHKFVTGSYEGWEEATPVILRDGSPVEAPALTGKEDGPELVVAIAEERLDETPVA